MIAALIRWSVANRLLVLLATVFLTAAGLWGLRTTPVDALPDLSDVQVIVRTSWPGQAPQIVEIDASQVTLDHAAVPALKWPAMTMPFKLADPALARGLKKGQAVSFSFDKQGDDYRITAIAPQVEPADPHAGHAPAAAASGASR